MRPIEKKPILAQVVQNLENEIRKGKYSVGDTLPSEIALCNDLGVSRSTVREAYRTLQALGYLEIKRGKGCFLKQTHSIREENIEEWFVKNKARLSDLMEVRFALEPLSVKLAIERGTMAQIEEIASVNEDFREAADNQDSAMLSVLDEAFHTAIVKAGNNDFLIKINHVIAAALKDYRMRAFSVKENSTNAVAPHAEILDGILNKDVSKAIDAMERHLEISLQDIEDVVRSE